MINYPDRSHNQPIIIKHDQQEESRMAQMTQAQIAEFLAPPRHAIVATNRADGPPQLSPVWYLYEAGKLYISVSAAAVKVKNLQRDPRITVCVDAGHPDARYVILQGSATILAPEHPEQEPMRWRIIQHYYTTEQEALDYYASVRDSASALIVLDPTKVTSQDFT